MKELPVTERPYEKCLSVGAESLSDAELLAVILRSGTEGITALELAYSILNLFNPESGLSDLNKVNITDLCKLKGIGKVKAIQLKCVAELSKRISMAAAGEGRLLNSSFAVAEYCMEQMRHLDHEEILLLSFTTRGKLLTQKTVSIGTVSQSVITPREVFLEAMKSHAAYVILVHNHPSGNSFPSEEDDLMTLRMRDAGMMIGIELMDHIVIGDKNYFSYRDHGQCGLGE